MISNFVISQIGPNCDFEIINLMIWNNKQYSASLERQIDILKLIPSLY